MNNWLSVESKSNESAQIKIHGTIGGGFFEEGVTDEQVESDLEEIKNLKASVINVDLASLGGSVIHGMRIFDLLKGSSSEINIKITGWTASMGSIIAQAASPGKLTMSENAQILFHEARGISFGTASQMEADAINIRNFNQQAENIIAKRSGMTKSEAKELLGENNSEGIFMLPKQAKKKGLIDEVFKPENNRMAANVTEEELTKYKIKAKINLNKNNMKLDIVEIKKNVKGAYDAFMSALKGDEKKDDKNIEQAIAKASEVIVDSLQESIDEVSSTHEALVAKMTTEYSEMETKYNKLKASGSDGEGGDAPFGGKPILSEADKAAEEFKASLSASDKMLMIENK